MLSSELSELSKLRVCFLTHNLRRDNGAGVFSLRLIEGLKKELGVEPVIFTSEKNPKLWREFFKIRRAIKNCYAVHALDAYPYGVLAYLASFGLGKKLIITAIGSGAIQQLYNPFRGFFLRRAYFGADKVTAISNFTAREILKCAPNLAIEVINHGVDYKKFNILTSDVDRTPDVQKFKPYILSVGSLRWRKGYHRSIEAFVKISKQFPDLKYVIVGKKCKDDYYNRLKLEVRDLKLEGKVIILDNVDNEEALINLYQNAELFCLMSQTANHDMEGFGLVFLEAAAAGLPVVGTLGSGVEDAVLDGENGFLVGPRDVDGFAEKISQILKNKKLKESMSKASLDLAARSGWEARISDYANLYKKLQNQKIVYVTNSRLPTEKAHGLATVKIAEAFSDLGYQTEMIVPRRHSVSGGEVFQYYGIKRNFRIKKLPTIDLFGFLPEKLAFWLQLFSFSLIVMIYSVLKYRRDLRDTIFFSHDHIPLYFLSFLPARRSFSEGGARIFYDIHHFPGKNIFYNRVLQRSKGLAVQTRWKVDALARQFGLDPERIVYWPNGTDLQKFRNIDISRSEARKKLNLPEGKKIVLYTGQLFDWKGVNTLIEAADLLKKTADIYIVGGAQKKIANVKYQMSNVKFVSFRPHAEIPLWLRAADILVLPNTGKQKVSLYYTSPMKMFEYMASGTPIVASAIPSILEILNESNAILAEADSPQSFAEKIVYALENYQKAGRLGLQAQKDVEKYTWEERASKISKLFHE